MSSRPSYFLFTKWTKGESVEKSARSKPTASKEQNGAQTSADHQEGYSEAHCDSDGDGGLGYGGRMCSTIDQGASGFTRQANKRDSFNAMLSGRDMHTQMGQNPFLAGESYLNHLKIQEDFLRPQNTAVMEPKKDG